jgi:hypothetical protein
VNDGAPAWRARDRISDRTGAYAAAILSAQAAPAAGVLDEHSRLAARTELRACPTRADARTGSRPSARTGSTGWEFSPSRPEGAASHASTRTMLFIRSVCEGTRRDINAASGGGGDDESREKADLMRSHCASGIAVADRSCWPLRRSAIMLQWSTSPGSFRWSVRWYHTGVGLLTADLTVKGGIAGVPTLTDLRLHAITGSVRCQGVSDRHFSQCDSSDRQHMYGSV